MQLCHIHYYQKLASKKVAPCKCSLTTMRERFSRIKNLWLALQKSRPCKCGFTRATFLQREWKIFYAWKSFSQSIVTHSRLDSLDTIAFGKNRPRDLRCRLYFARLDARIVLARAHLHEVDFNVSRVLGQSRARVNSRSYAIFESPRHSAMHKRFAGCWLQLP